MALIENIQRENLNPIDEALAYRRLADEFHLTQEADCGSGRKGPRDGRQLLRLLRLPDEVRADVAAGTLSMGHARALLALPSEADQRRMAREVIARSLSVRETESMVRSRSAARRRRRRQRRHGSTCTRAPPKIDSVLLSARASASSARARKGRIEIEFDSEDELIRVYELLTEN